MIKNHKFLSLFAITLIAALLLSMSSRATSVYALAVPDWEMAAELAPIYDTQIIQLQDYIQNNVTQPQFEIFNILLGLYVAAQGGFSEYKLNDPYATQDGLLAWLKSCGIQIYNSLIGMNAIGVDPITGIDYRPYIKGVADIAMGCAVKSTQYTDVNDFISDVNVQEKYFIPLDFGIQGALNYIFAQDGGLYNWQFGVSEFEPNMTYQADVLPTTSIYWSYLESLTQPLVRVNYYNSNTSDRNKVYSATEFQNYGNVLFNTSNNKIYFYNDDGTQYLGNSIYLNGREVGVYSGSAYVQNIPQAAYNRYSFNNTYYTIHNNSWQGTVQYYIDNPSFINSEYLIFITDFVKHFYYGSSWSNKNEIFHNTDLNFDQNTLPYYQQVANDYLLDIKGILQGLLNTVDLKDVILNNIYDLTGVVVTDPVLTHVAIDILEEIQTINVPMPVNLNDIKDYTENTYLDLVKEHGENFGETIGEYVAFWHNSDPEITYVIFGALILTLIGAFVGKWGHS